MRTSAAAPSEMALEFAAVTVPPSRKAGLSCGIFSGVAFSGSSSWLTTRSILPAFTLMETISRCEAAIGDGFLRARER